MSRKFTYSHMVPGRTPKKPISPNIDPDHTITKKDLLNLLQPLRMRKDYRTSKISSKISKRPKLISGKTKPINNIKKSGRPIMDRLGLDLGTKHIVLSWKTEDGEVKSIHEVNGYIDLRRGDKFTENLLKKQGVPYVPYGDQLIAIGSKAEKLAYMFNKTLQRPMAEGGVSKTDENAQEIMAIIVKSIIMNALGQDVKDDTVLYYCTTAKALNDERLNVDFHKKIVKLLVEKFVGGGKISAFHINEARCLVLDEIGPAIGISWGAGTITVHAGFAGVPIFEFCLVGAGDRVDSDAAVRFGYDPSNPNGDYAETPTTIAHAKQKIDLSLMNYDNKVDQTIKIMYEIMIENVVNGIVRGFNENRDKVRFPEPVPVINAGGTSMPKGFIDLLRKEFGRKKDDLQIPIGEIRHAADPLHAVSKGCLAAAELHEDEE